MTHSRAVLTFCTRLVSDMFFSNARWHVITSRVRQAGMSGVGELLHADKTVLRQTLTLSEEECEKIITLRMRDGLDEALRQLEKYNIHVITCEDDDYPQNFFTLKYADRPPVLYCSGNTQLLNHEKLAVVGSRNATDGAMFFAKTLGKLCANQQVSIVSGGAKGVDIAAQSACIQEGGNAILVLPCGLMHRYACEQYNASGNTLLVLSPFHPLSDFSAANAHARNKLIYALSNGAVAVEAERNRGGTWHGALFALRRNYPLHVRDAGMGKGNSQLIRMGAMPLPDKNLEGLNVRELFEVKEQQQVIHECDMI